MPRALDLANLPDADLVSLALAGRDAAFRELIRRYERPVFSLVLRLVEDRDTAADIAQVTFVKVLSHLDHYRAEFKFSSWLFKIAHNTALDHLRRRSLPTVRLEGARPGDATGGEGEGARLQVADAAAGPLDQLVARELGDQIERAIATLRPEYRTCILLRHVEGRSYEEIASTLDLPLGTVKTYIHRARQELRRALEHTRD